MLRLRGYGFFVGEDPQLVLEGLIVSREPLFEVFFALFEDVLVDVDILSEELHELLSPSLVLTLRQSEVEEADVPDPNLGLVRHWGLGHNHGWRVLLGQDWGLVRYLGNLRGVDR